MTTITVFKQNVHGDVVFSYTGDLIERDHVSICIDARFGRSDVDAGYVVFRRGDRMIEWFYSDRWYNIFRLEDGDSGTLKGWYCNITRPAHIDATSIRADDLALDVFIYPDGEVLVLDEDEFRQLALSEQEQAAAWDAVARLRAAAAHGIHPFSDLQPGGSSLFVGSDE